MNPFHNIWLRQHFDENYILRNTRREERLTTLEKLWQFMEMVMLSENNYRSNIRVSTVHPYDLIIVLRRNFWNFNFSIIVLSKI